MKKKKVFFISQYLPHFANSGIALKNLSLLKCLTEVADVVGIFLLEDREGVKRALQQCDVNVSTHIVDVKIPQTSAGRYLYHLYQILFVPKAVKNEIWQLFKHYQPDLFWLEFGYIGHLIPYLRSFGKPIFYGSHNSQFALDFSIWQRIRNPAIKMKSLPRVACLWFHENHFFPMADRVWCISQADLEYYQKKIPAKKLGILPYFFDHSYVEAEESMPDSRKFIVMVGNLRSYQNYDAALYALQHIWPLVLQKMPSLSLYIIGRLPEDGSFESTEIKNLAANRKSVYLLGEVASVVPYVKTAVASIVPIRIGSGVRTKIIESVACKTPVVSTTLGAESLPFEDGHSICIADQAEAFAERVLELVGSPRQRAEMAERAYQLYNEKLSMEAGIRIVKEILEDESNT